MKIKSNILYDLLDQNTGEQVTYVKTTIGYDGTIITPENEVEYVDGVVYKKLKASDGGGYAKRVTTDGYGFIEWFVGDDFSDGVANFNAIKVINKAGLKVKLPEGDIPLQAVSNTDSFINPKPLVWEGAGKDKTKVILETKHSDVGGSGTNSYFKGNQSIYFRDLTLTTRSIEDNVLTEIGSEYEFISVLNPTNIIVNFIDCRINGSITYRFKTEAGLADTNYVKLLSIKRCEFNYVSSVIIFSACYCITTDVQDNFIYELLGNIVFLAEGSGDSLGGGAGNRLVKWVNNYLENTIVPSATTWYHCPIVTRCFEMIYERNFVKNLLNTDMTARAQIEETVYGAETYACYATATHFYYRNNIINNVSGIGTSGTSTCFKVKGATNVYCENNEIKLDRGALVKIGVLATATDNLNTINIANYKYSLINSMTGTRTNAEFVFKNNKINVVTINRVSYLPWGNIDFSDNTIEVEYMPIRDAKQSLVFVIPDELTAPALEKSVIDRNFITIAGVEDPNIRIDFFNRDQYNLLDSTTTLRKLHSISENTFGGNVTYLLGLRPAKEIKYNNNKIISEDTKIEIELNDYTSTDGLLVPLAKFNSSTKVPKIRNVYSEARPKLFGKSIIQITDNTEDTLRLMSTGLNDWYVNDIVSETLPTLISFKIEYIDNITNQVFTLKYNIAQHTKSSIRYKDEATNTITTFDPRLASAAGPIEIANKFNVSGHNVKMYMQRFLNRTCHFYLTGMSTARQVKITSNVWQQSVDSATFYNLWLATETLSLDSLNSSIVTTQDDVLTLESDVLTINQDILDLETNKADTTFATTTTKGLIKLADIPIDSAAVDHAALLADFNNLLQKLRDQNTE